MHSPTTPPPVTRATHQRILASILILFVLLAGIYSVITPPFEASDELWHYPMVKTLADNDFALPVQDPSLGDDAAPWRQEGGQPPLYYMLGAALTRWIDTSDMREVRRLNPHPDIGVVVPDGNANMVVHHADREGWPWQGTILALRLVRFMSILMGLGTVYLTYVLARDLFPAYPALALVAAALTAFNPMFLFVSAVVNNDNLSTLLATTLLVMIVCLVKQPHQVPPTRLYVALGIVAGAGMLAKFQIGFLLPLVALALLLVTVHTRDWRPLIIGGAISGSLTILIAGWWYWRNYDLYGDATGINVFLDIVGRRQVPADLRQLWTEREAFYMSYWGFFGGLNVPMDDWVYRVFNLLAAISAAGLLVLLVAEAAVRLRTRTCPPNRPLYQARAIAALWPVIVFISLLSWTRQTWATQGRLMFSAIAPLSLGMAAGLMLLFLLRSRWRLVGLFTGTGSAAIFVVLAALAPFTTIRPAYELDHDAAWASDQEIDGVLPVCFREPDANADGLCAAASPLAGTLQPGDYLKFDPTLTVKNPLTRDWSLFVHLVGDSGIIEAQRDIYPGGGLLAVSEIQPGDDWRNRVAVQIPDGIYTPQTLTVYWGFYDLNTGDRMIPVGTNTDPASNRQQLGEIDLVTPPGDVPNPVAVNFGGVLRLRGYEIAARSLAPGGTTTFTFYWQALTDIDRDYVVSLQVLNFENPASAPAAAQIDAPPDPPTSAWAPEDAITTTRTVTIRPDAPPGRYRVLVRVYPADDPARPLRIITDTGGQSQDFVWLNWLQVE